MAPINDRRRFSRIPFDGKVEVSTKQGSYESELIDISLKGALIKRPENFNSEEDEILDIRIQRHDDSSFINMQATVGHLERSILGLQCVSIDIDSITELRKLVELNLGDSSLLNRELAELCRPE